MKRRKAKLRRSKPAVRPSTRSASDEADQRRVQSLMEKAMPDILRSVPEAIAGGVDVAIFVTDPTDPLDVAAANTATKRARPSGVWNRPSVNRRGVPRPSGWMGHWTGSRVS